MKPNERYKAYIKTLACLIDDNCYGMVDPHHLRARGMGGKNKSGEKDFTCVCLCRKHHSEVEQIGITKFQVKYEIDLKYELTVLQKRWGLHERGEG